MEHSDWVGWSQLMIVELATHVNIRESWASYFQMLATPKETDHYNSEYKRQVNLGF